MLNGEKKDWKKVKLGEVCEMMKTGKTPPTNIKEYFNHEVNWFNPSDIGYNKELLESKRKISKKAIIDKKALLFPPDSILLTCIGDIGRCGIIRSPSSSNQQITCIFFNNAIVLSDYAYYWFIKNQTIIEYYANNALVPIINNQNLKQIIFTYPPLTTQKHIASILDKADALRKKDRQLLDYYDQLLQSVFHSMFGDPIKNEKGWEKIEIQNLISKIQSLNKKSETSYIDYVDISSVNNQYNTIENITKYKFNERPSRAQQILKNGDILLSTVRPNLKNIALNTTDGLIASTGFFVLRVAAKMSNWFLFELLKTKATTEDFVKITSGANYPALKNSDLLKYKLISPPITLQNQFAAIAQNIQAQKEKVKDQMEASEQLFEALLQQAFRR